MISNKEKLSQVNFKMPEKDKKEALIHNIIKTDNSNKGH